MFLSNQNKMRKLYKGPAIDAPYQILIHLAKQFLRRFFNDSANQKQESSVAAICFRSRQNKDIL